MEEAKVLITIVVQRKDSTRLMKAAAGAGVPGLTYFYARGTGVRQRLGFLGGLIEPEKVVFKIVLPQQEAAETLAKIMKQAGLDEPGRGFGYIVPVLQTAGYYE